MTNNCRECGHFYRVTPKKGGLGYISCQGFCILGRLCGDFSLYMSTSTSSDCGGFFLSDYNKTTMSMEDVLSRKLDDFRRALMDRRTKEYKMLWEKCDDAIREYMKSTTPLERWCLNERSLRDAFVEVFKDVNREEIMNLIHRKRMYRDKYGEIIGKITTELKGLSEDTLIAEYQKEESDAKE